jgi:hypothetical protein
MSKKLVKYRKKKYQDEHVLSSYFVKISLIFLGHYLHGLCRFNASFSLMSNHLAHLYHVPSIIVETGKVHSTLNKLFRASKPLLVIIPH